MTTKKEQSASSQDAPRSRVMQAANVVISGSSVRVWSEVGVTIPISDDPPAFLRFTFGHERLAKNSTAVEVEKAAALIDDFNRKELERRIRSYKRIVRTTSADDEDEGEPKSKKKRKKKLTPRERARREAGY